jgi:hypothetical protein
VKREAKTVTGPDGKVYSLVTPEKGEAVLCPGEAHSNPFSDNCMLCAPDWGTIRGLKPVPLSALTPGSAVAYGHVDSDAFQSAEEEDTVELVMVEEKTSKSHRAFFAYVVKP